MLTSKPKVYQRLDAYIQKRGFKQRTIAEKAGLTQNQMSMILNGKMKLSADDLDAICQAMECSPSKIFSMPVPPAKSGPLPARLQ